jgi:hypothetical protein
VLGVGGRLFPVFIAMASLALASCASLPGVQNRTWTRRGDRFVTQPLAISLNESGETLISIPDLPSIHLSASLALAFPSGDNSAFFGGDHFQLPGLDAELAVRVRTARGEFLVAQCDIFRVWGWGGPPGGPEVSVSDSFDIGPLSGPLLVSIAVTKPSSKPALARLELWATPGILMDSLPPNQSLQLTGRPGPG